MGLYGLMTIILVTLLNKYGIKFLDDIDLPIIILYILNELLIMSIFYKRAYNSIIAKQLFFAITFTFIFLLKVIILFRN